MARIELNKVSVVFPVVDARRQSLRHQLVSIGLGRRIGEDHRHRISIRALSDITLTFENGDRIALIGGNGAGKSTLLRVLAGVYEPTRGEIWREGRLASLLDINFGMEPDCTGYENIMMRGLYLGISFSTLKARIEEIAEFAELGDFLAMPLRTYSSGMNFRLAFSISTCIEPEILLMDEWISAGDMQFVKKIECRLQDFVGRSGITVLASHDTDLLQRTCNKAVLLEDGRIIKIGTVSEVLDCYWNRPAAECSVMGWTASASSAVVPHDG